MDFMYLLEHVYGEVNILLPYPRPVLTLDMCSVKGNFTLEVSSHSQL